MPGETKIWQYIALTKKIFLIDSPGVVYDVGDNEVGVIVQCFYSDIHLRWWRKNRRVAVGLFYISYYHPANLGLNWKSHDMFLSSYAGGDSTEGRCACRAANKSRRLHCPYSGAREPCPRAAPLRDLGVELGGGLPQQAGNAKGKAVERGRARLQRRG